MGGGSSSHLKLPKPLIKGDFFVGESITEGQAGKIFVGHEKISGRKMVSLPFLLLMSLISR